MKDTAIEAPPGSAEVAHTLRRIARFAGVVAALLGATVLLGWVIGSDVLRAFLPGHASGKPNAGLALILGGAVQWLQGTPRTRPRHWIGIGLATLVGLIGAATLAEYWLDVDLGIDELFFREERGAVETAYPGRMAVVGAMECIGFAMVSLFRASRMQRLQSAAQWLGLCGLLLAGTVLLGYTFGAHAMYALAGSNTISLPVALGMAALFLSLLAAEPGTGWMARISGQRAGGVMLRRLLPAVIVGPWVVGWISLQGAAAGLYGASIDQVVVVFPLMLLFAGLLYGCARVLDRLDAERERRRSEVEALNRELESRVQKRTEELLSVNDQLRSEQMYVRSLIESSIDALATIDPAGKITDVNRQMEALTGSARAELIGRPFKHYFTEPERAEEGVRRVLREGRVADYELSARHRDGRETPVAYNASTFFDPHGRLMGVFAAARDITERKRAEEALRIERKRFLDVLDGLPAYIILLTPDYHVSFSNRVFRERFGESHGRRCFEFLFQRDTPCEVCDTYRVLRTMTPLEWKWTGPDGRNYEISDFPFTDADGTTLILEMGIDVTERNQAQQELRRTNRALVSLSRCTEAVARASDEAGLLQQVCDLIVKVGGYPLAWVGYAQDDAAKSVQVAAVGGFGAEYVRNARITWAETERGQGPTGTAIRTGEACYIPDVALDPRFTPWREAAARHGYASVMAAPLKDGSRAFGALNLYAPEQNAFDEQERSLMLELASTLSHGILALRTRLERDRAAAELVALNDSLEQRVTERTAALGVAMRDLEAFTYSVSHDLRAPLRHIDGFSKVLLDQHAASLDEEGRHYLDRVRQATQRMGRLIDDLLKLSRIGRAELRCEPVDLNAVAREVIEELREETAQRNVEWRLGPLPVTSCDAGLTRQVFFNLLANAVKFTRGRDPAVIEIGAQGAEIFVRDNGVGFDPHYADKLFGVFQRLHRVEDFEGTGVGLATVRRIVRKHGGDIRPEAAPDSGATFYFTLAGPSPGSGASSEVPHAA